MLTQSWFPKFARRVEQAAGSPSAFIVATLIVVAWFAFGPMFGWSDTYQLVINTGTTIVTFLMVFLIQGSQNRDVTAIQLKLDELIHSIDEARNELIGLEDLDVNALAEAKAELQAMKGKEDV